MTADILDLDETNDLDVPPVKRRRPKKDAQRIAFGRQSDALFTAPEPSSAPSSSWWLGVPADKFSECAAAEQERMQHSKFGRIPSVFITEIA